MASLKIIYGPTGSGKTTIAKEARLRVENAIIVGNLTDAEYWLRHNVDVIVDLEVDYSLDRINCVNAEDWFEKED